MMAQHTAQYPAQYGRRRVAVLTAGPSGVLGGAERFYNGLLDGLLEIGCRAELVSVPADERSFEEIESNYDKCRQMDLSAFDVVISSKAPTYAVNHPHHVVFHNHTTRVFYDMFAKRFPNPSPEEYRQRAKLFELDFQALSRTKAILSQGHETANRLYRWLGLKSEVLPAPLGIKGLKHGEIGDYFFLPGRLHPWKRVDLVIDAVRQSALPLRLIISGAGEAEADLKLRGGNDPRIEFRGRVNDEELIELYANALAVPFVPIREDYGYVTLEAFASAKAVVTCSDSGEPTYFVRNGDTGLVCEPNPESIRQALEWLSTHRDDARQMGQKGAALVAGMSWPKVASRLLDAALADGAAHVTKPTQVTVLDMQPIDPPVGGGRLRLLGLYHNLGEGVDCHYVGTYDWPGERYRKHRLSAALEEVDVPLSDEHHAAARALSLQAGGKTVIDVAFGKQGHLSKDYLEATRRSMRDADIVVFSHPWVFPLVAKDLAPHQLVVYDSHNVEGYLRAQLLDENNPAEAELLRQVAQDEYELGCRADLILACSHEDLLRFQRIYEFPPEKMRVVPNGVMAFANPVPDRNDESSAKTKLKLAPDRLVAVFIGSAYGPNVEAGEFIVKQLAAALPEVTFAIAGGVGARLSSDKNNVIVTGPLNEEEKRLWLTAADIAVNPMFSGSGTNIKMFDFMAMSLPTVATAVGARGIEVGERRAMLVVPPTPQAFTQAIRQLRDETLRIDIGREARLCVEEGYAWERISDFTGRIFAARCHLFGQQRPHFSVVVSNSQRHDNLLRLLECLQSQIERDFEVVVVDQDDSRWPAADAAFGFPISYYRSPIRNKRRAWNAGASIAQGEIVVFADEHCRPDKLWLLNSRSHSRGSDIVAVHFARNLSDDVNLKSDAAIPLAADDAKSDPRCLAVRSRVFHGVGGLDLSAAGLSRGTKASQLPKSISFVTTWGGKCGIAEYSRHIANELVRLGYHVNVYSLPNSDAVPMAPDDALEVHRDSWCNAECSFVSNADELGNVVWFQHHIAFYHLNEAMIRRCRDLHDSGRLPVITLHSTMLLLQLDDDARALAARCLHGFAIVFVHTASDIENLKLLGVASNVMLMRQGVKRAAAVGRGNGASLRIGGFGFLFPHKGIYELITAYAEIVKRRKHNIEPLRLITSVRSEPSSSGELQRCRKLIDDLGIGDRIEWYTEYLKHEEVERLLSECSLAVLPYQNTPESSSAAVRTVLASCPRVGTSPSSIFDEVRDATFAIEGYDARAVRRFIEKAIDGFDAETSRKVDKARKEWLAVSDWNNVAREYDNVFRLALKLQKPNNDEISLKAKEVFVGKESNQHREETNDLDLLWQLISTAQGNPLFKTEIPSALLPHMAEARRSVEDIAGEIAGQFLEYFNTSKERYATYIAAARGYLPDNATILDVGDAPGHVAMCLHRLGFAITGLNLNAEWRKTYPDPTWLETLSVQECDIEKSALPFHESQFDAILFTEVLEHIAVTDPSAILKEFRRVLKPGGLVLFSTPNVCNISNICALLHGMNIFWAPKIFYGSCDRHNREYTPSEVIDCFQQAGLEIVELWGINDHANWRAGGGEFAYELVSKFGDNSFLLRNTIVGIFKNA
jgi:glycosyltransferase involved in cell wall biosynthesis/2-polyprenyl-3-methyl-5-hydroxy-6-metoxy-1,4-benzoquinol methylase